MGENSNLLSQGMVTWAEKVEGQSEGSPHSARSRAVLFPGSFSGAAKPQRLCWQPPKGRQAALQAALTWLKHSPSPEQVSHLAVPQAVPAAWAVVHSKVERPGHLSSSTPAVSHLGLLPTMGTFSIALLLVPLMQRLCRQSECQQNDGPAFIYLRLLMEGGQNALWPQSKRLIDCHYWRLSVNRAVTKKWFQCYYTNLRTHFPARQPGSLKQKEFCCRGTW